MISPLNSEPYKMKPAAFKVFNELQTAIAELEAKEEELGKQVFAIQQAAGGRPLKSAESDKLIDLDEARAALIPDELALRRRLAKEWFPLQAQERLRVDQEAQADVPATRERVKQMLVGIGYPATTQGEYEAIPNDYFIRHPAFQAARRTAEETAQLRLDRSEEKANADAIKQLEEQLKARSRRAGR